VASIYRLLNPTINALLRSPLHGILSWRVMTVHYTGRKSGQRYATPVSYFRDGDRVVCFTNGRWRHNFREPRSVRLQIAGASLQGTALASPATLPANVATMSRYFAAVRADAKFYGVGFDEQGAPDQQAVERAAVGMTMIAIRLQPR
jgi:hypothetical protein